MTRRAHQQVRPWLHVLRPTVRRLLDGIEYVVVALRAEAMSEAHDATSFGASSPGEQTSG